MCCGLDRVDDSLMTQNVFELSKQKDGVWNCRLVKSQHFFHIGCDNSVGAPHLSQAQEGDKTGRLNASELGFNFDSEKRPVHNTGQR